MGVFGLLVFIFQFFKLIFLFFTGRTLFSDLKEDVELKALLSKEKEQVEETPAEEEKKEENPMSLYPSDSIVYGSGYSSPLVEEKKEVEQKPEPEPQPQIEVEPDEIIDNNKEGGDY